MDGWVARSRRRTAVAEVFLNVEPDVRLVGAPMVEMNEKMAAAERVDILEEVLLKPQWS
jgi:hypothetical protein